MTPSEVLASFVTMDMMSKCSDHAIAHARVAKRMDLALKASKVQVEDDDCGGSDTCLDHGDVDVAWNEHISLESRSFWKKGNFKSNSSRSNTKVMRRTKDLLQLWKLYLGVRLGA